MRELTELDLLPYRNAYYKWENEGRKGKAPKDAFPWLIYAECHNNPKFPNFAVCVDESGELIFRGIKSNGSE